MNLTLEQKQKLEEFIVGCYHECDTFVDGMFDCYHPCKKCGAEDDLDHLDFEDGNVFLRTIEKLRSIPDLEFKLLHVISSYEYIKLTGWVIIMKDLKYRGEGFDTRENLYRAVLAWLEGRDS